MNASDARCVLCERKWTRVDAGALAPDALAFLAGLVTGVRASARGLVEMFCAEHGALVEETLRGSGVPAQVVNVLRGAGRA